MSQIPNATGERKPANPIRGEFAVELRHRCRHCRSKLPAPVENQHDAFCCRGCHTSFHRKRCVSCERPIERKSERQLVCGKRRCRNALQTRQGLGRYLASSNGFNPSENPIKPGIKIAHPTGRPWRQLAGPELGPISFHYTTVGAAEAVEASRRANARYWRSATAALIGRTDPPVNLLGGYKFPNVPGVELTAPPAAARAGVAGSSHTFSADLSIPDFLKVKP